MSLSSIEQEAISPVQAPAASRGTVVGWLKYGLCTVASAVLVVAAWRQWIPTSLTEALGFATGAFCVLLTVDAKIANFPVGLGNNVFLFVVFLGARLYADMSLQVVFFVLGVIGWWSWLYGGPSRTRLTITRARRWEWIVLPPLAAALTYGMSVLLAYLGDAAPLRDAATAVLSIAAQYLLNRKRFEHWWVWILVDLISIQLYIDRQIYLTAGLYVLFLGLCVAGLWQWRRTLAAASLQPAAGGEA
ncbi:MAG: nicotinamide riboside transporter PnuC [Planctomycetaceae bacterium]|nr:nicotinamide riboside transporter PnuC [Planctomycetaceae bacterium]